MIARVRANPRPALLILGALALIFGFVTIVSPLFNTSGVSTAELAGSLPTQAVAKHTLEIDLGLDNTGVSGITPICVRAEVQGPVTPQYGVFQGIDREAFSQGRVCGGTLSGQEDVSVRLFFLPTQPGTARITLTPASGTTQVGPPLSTALTVTRA